MGIKAVAFDLDGTLYPAHALYLRSVDIGIRNATLLRAYSLVRRELRGIALTDAYIREPPEDGTAFRKFQAALVARRLRMGERSVAERLERVVYREFPERFADLPPYPGVPACLDRLRAHGLPLALLSDLPPGRKIALMHLADRFQIIQCAEDSGFLKPSGKPFAVMAEALGLDPGEILYVGNKRHYDVKGGRDAGMSTAIVTRGKCGEADLAFHDWTALPGWILERT